MKLKTEPCKNCEVPVYLDYEGGGGPRIGGRMADWVWVHVGHEHGAGCDNPEPRPGRRVTDLPGL